MMTAAAVAAVGFLLLIAGRAVSARARVVSDLSKRFVPVAAAMALLVLVAVGAAVADETSPIGAGVWSTIQQRSPGSEYCADGAFTADTKDFCIDPGTGESSVELGVKVTSSEAVNIVGVRVYRVDSGSVTGSLWGVDGTRLAGPASFSGSSRTPS